MRFLVVTSGVWRDQAGSQQPLESVRGPDAVQPQRVQQWGGTRTPPTPRLAKTSLAPPTSQALPPAVPPASDGSPVPPSIGGPRVDTSVEVELASSPPTDSFSKVPLEAFAKVPLARALDFSQPPQASRLSTASVENGGLTQRGAREEEGLVQRMREAQRGGLGEQASREYAFEIAGSALVWADSSQLSARSEESRTNGRGPGAVSSSPRVRNPSVVLGEIL
eukprot:1216856-Rhodomonas_salina.1